MSDAAGFNYVGMSWGSSWGDFNSDGWPDLWTSNHHRPPSLYQNMRDGTFRDVASQVIPLDVWTAVKGYDHAYGN